MRDIRHIGWSRYPDTEHIPGKVSGAWLVVGTRVPVDAVLDNADYGCSAEDIVTQTSPSLPLNRVQRLLAHARASAHAPHPD